MINLPFLKKKIKLEQLHPPPPLKIKKYVGCTIEISIIEEKMRIGGYEKQSHFIRDLIKNYNKNGIEEKLLEITNMISDLSGKIISIYSNNLSNLTLDQRKALDQQYKSAKEQGQQVTKGDIFQSDAFKLAKDLKEMMEKVGSIKNILTPPPREELEKKRPKTDHTSFMEFKEQKIKNKNK